MHAVRHGRATTPGQLAAASRSSRIPTPSLRALNLANAYEQRTSLFTGWREQLIERLAPRPGDTVLDINCGPGLNLAALRERVGPQGRIVGIERSPELLAVARHRVHRRGWHNVELLAAPPSPDQLPHGADAALLCAADDVLQSPTTLAYLFTGLRPGARVAAGGWKLPAEWLWPLRVYLRSFRGPRRGTIVPVEEPWRLLRRHVPDLAVSQLGFGTGYLAHGTLPY